MFCEVVLTVAESKRLIAKGVAGHPDVLRALTEGIVVVCKGTTNAYVAEELLGREIKRTDYVTGATLPSARKGPSPVAAKLPDVVLERGQVVEGVTSKDMVDKLKCGDVFIKGANAISYERGQAALLIGHPTGGTIGAAIGVLVARRVRLLIPVGLEKNIPGDLNDVAARVAEATETAEDKPVPALWPLAGELFTEIEAFRLLTECDAIPIGGGGIAGAEGAVRLMLEGTDEQIRHARKLVEIIRGEPPFVAEGPSQ